MARIARDRGLQVYQVPPGVDPRGGTARYHEFDLDCSCTLRVSESYLRNRGRMGVMSRLDQIAESHICEVETFMVHTQEAAERRERARRPFQDPRARAAVDLPVAYMGIQVAADAPVRMLSSGFNERWDTFGPSLLPGDRVRRRRTPAEVEASVRANPAPRQAPEAQVRAAAAIRGESLTTVIVDEVADYPAPAPKAAEKKDLVKLDRFQLIELD